MVTGCPEPVMIRAARPDEAAAISELAVRSKGHWGYNRSFLEACRDDLALSPTEIATSPVYVYENDNSLCGFYRLLPAGDHAAELDALFVDPSAIGQGVGRRLWEHAVSTAGALGYRELLIQSDPHAEGFYRTMGAKRIGQSASTVSPGRMLPLLRHEVGSGESGVGRRDTQSG